MSGTSPQLGAPFIAAFAAVMRLGEALDLRLISGGALVVGGLALALGARRAGAASLNRALTPR